MASISGRPNVVDLTGEDSETELDETSFSPFHADLLKKFKARSGAGAVKCRQQQGVVLREQSDTLHQSSLVSIPTAIGEPIHGTTEPSLALKPIANPPSPNITSRALESSPKVQHGAWRKRNAEQAFKDDENLTLYQRSLSQSARFPYFSTKIANLSKPKDVKGRSGFDDLLSQAEASVTSRQDELMDPFTRPSSVTGRRNEQEESSARLSSATTRKDIAPSVNLFPGLPPPSPKTFSPPTLQQASLGSSIHIVPISDVVVPVQLPLKLDQRKDWPASSQAGSTTQFSNLTQTTLVPGSIEFDVTSPFRTPFQLHAGFLDYATQPLSRPTETSPTQLITPIPNVRYMPFDSSILPLRQGHPFTDAEQVIMIYLKEELNVGWTDVDRRMGRTTNCCATKYLRKFSGIKYKKRELRYRERAAVIRSIIATMPNATIEKVFRLLDDFIKFGTLPPGCSDIYNIILETAPSDKAPEPLPRPSPSIVQAFSPFEPPVRGRLRPGARTNEGDMDLKAMTRRIHDTQDVLSDEASVFLDANSSGSGSDTEYHTLARKEYPEGSVVRRKRPYLDRKQRGVMKGCLKTVNWEDENWAGLSVHLDPGVDEIESLLHCANAVIKNPDGFSLESVLQNATHTEMVVIAQRAKLSPQFRDRTKKSIQAMLTDATNGDLDRTPMRFRMAASATQQDRISSRLLRREIGSQTASRSIRRTIQDSLAPARSWTGASGDVGTVAWSPDGRHFAAGAMCIVDPSSMQYNRSNNLLFGDMQYQTLCELPEHHRAREKPQEGANSSHSMHVSQDPRLFFTVSMVDFSRDGSRMFSVGYDNFLRSYEVGSGHCNQKWAVDHGAEVDLLAISRRHDHLATGSRDIESGVRIYATMGANEVLTTLGSFKARNFTDKKIYPSSIRWGTHSVVENYLLAGFAPTAGDETYATTHGETCLWDVARQTPLVVNPSAGNIFDVAWSPRSNRFATACSSYGQMHNKGTHSLVRICSPIDMNTWSNRGLELECSARDINDVVFCPYDENYVAAGATDSQIYVWDIRRPDKLFQRLSHGKPLAELDPGISQEIGDCGVRFCGWGENRERLLTGSSDGVVKVWDIHRAPQEAHVRDLASFNTGIMSGAFNHDFSSLLIGEVNGTINLLEVGADPPDLLKDLDTFRFEPSTVVEPPPDPKTPTKDRESGRHIGKRLLKAEKIKFRPLAGFPIRRKGRPMHQAVQGAKYDGPYDSAPDAEQLREKAAVFQKTLMLEILDEHGNVVRDPRNHNKVTKRPQCTIKACGQHVFVTEEDKGDSGRAVDRISQAIRDVAIGALAGNDTKEGKMVPGMLRCSHCGGLARPRVGDEEQEEYPLCERCGFSCFRCGERVKVGLAVEQIGCASCGLEWRVGALGYEVIPSASTTLGSSAREKEVVRDVPPSLHLISMDQTAVSLKQKGMEETLGGLEDLGDLLYLVEEYYHGLWEENPTSSV